LPAAHLRDIFVASAKGRVLERLRRAPQTVEELASSLGVTGNAVRSHLSALERDGLVRRGNVRRGLRRPSYTYRLAAGAEALFCQGYAPFVDQLLHVLAGEITSRQLDAVIRAAGRRMALARAAEPLPARVQAAAAVMDELGGITEIKTRHNGGVTFVIHGVSCPLDALVRSHHGVCAAIESLVAEITRARAREQCHRAGDQPHCLIEITPDESKTRRTRAPSATSR
jgi:predicted ArsR family transcriptional regulator